MFLGEFSPALFFKLTSYVIIITLFIIYYVSQWEGHEPPFPKCWISDCAGHYPQFVFFRFATISGAVFVILGWMTNHFYLKSISREAIFKIEPYHPEIAMVFGLIGAMLLMGSTANLDTGKRHPKWHTFCASRFFIFTLLAQIYNTVIYCLVRYKIGKVSMGNLYFKLVLIGLIVLQFAINAYYGVFEQIQSSPAVDNSVGVILEWTLTVTIIAGFYSMGVDVQNFKFVYQLNPPSRIPSQTGIDEVD